jgi:hypothetical protein
MEKVLLKIMDHDCWVTQVTQTFKVTLEILGCEGKGCFLRIKGESEKVLDFMKNHKDISSFTILANLRRKLYLNHKFNKSLFHLLHALHTPDHL